MILTMFLSILFQNILEGIVKDFLVFSEEGLGFRSLNESSNRYLSPQISGNNFFDSFQVLVLDGIIGFPYLLSYAIQWQKNRFIGSLAKNHSLLPERVAKLFLEDTNHVDMSFMQMWICSLPATKNRYN